MKTLIKKMRELSGMSQAQFAQELSTTTVSINRWENGKSLPNPMAQNQLIDFCKKHEIDLSQAVVEKFRYHGEYKNLLLYHGSKKGLVGDIAPEAVLTVTSVQASIWERTRSNH